jgi:hypothetical protein
MKRLGYAVIGGVFVLAFLGACEEMRVKKGPRAPVGASSPAAAQDGRSFKWKLEVDYPDDEHKEFTVLEGENPVRLRDPNWTCSYKRKALGDQRGPAEGLTIMCENGPDVVSTFAVCAGRGDRPVYESASLIIGNARVKMKHGIHATCESF